MVFSIIIGVVILIGVVLAFGKDSRNDCCGVSIEEQEWCNSECKDSPYKDNK